MPEDERNTPTCVGKTAKPCERMLSTEKHPHVRGEDDWERRNCWNRRETPPRAWGRLVKSFSLFFVAQKHPHVRGEDDYLYKEASGQRETPPRAWGRRIGNLRGSHKSRNTPTCVGKTGAFPNKLNTCKKHPHVRGEDDSVALSWPYVGETPPRAWGRRTEQAHRVCGRRNTPTCVGKTREEKGVTCPVSETPPRAWGRPERLKSFEGITQKHPHVRGEDPGVSPGPRFEAETPPRAWGRLSPFILFVCRPRNTPTCVGKTRTRRGPSCLTWKHPHVRGEDAFRLLSLR